MLKTRIDLTPHFVGGPMHGSMVPSELIGCGFIKTYSKGEDDGVIYLNTSYYRSGGNSFDYFVALGTSLEDAVTFIYSQLREQAR